MKLKLKHIAAATVLLASAYANATILTTVTPGTGGEMMLSVWQEGTPGFTDQSFAFDTGITTQQFLASKSTSQIWATLGASDAVWSGFLASTNLATLKYSVMGGQAFVPATVFATVTAGEEANIAGIYSNGRVTTMTTGPMNGYMGNVNVTGTHLTQANGESVNQKGSGAYYQDSNMISFNGTGWNNGNDIGVTSEFTSYRRAPGGTSVTGIEQVMPGSISFAKVGNDYVLSYTVAAVPEASGSALALAGFGIMGFVAVRRRKS